MGGIRRTRLEVELFVPATCGFILRMNEKRTDTGDVRRLGGSQQRILQKSLSNPLALLGHIDCKPGQ